MKGDGDGERDIALKTYLGEEFAALAAVRKDVRSVLAVCMGIQAHLRKLTPEEKKKQVGRGCSFHVDIELVQRHGASALGSMAPERAETCEVSPRRPGPIKLRTIFPHTSVMSKPHQLQYGRNKSSFS